MLNEIQNHNETQIRKKSESHLSQIQQNIHSSSRFLPHYNNLFRSVTQHEDQTARFKQWNLNYGKKL